MSLNNNDIYEEINQKHSSNKKPFTKEMLQELLKKHLNQRLIKLEDSTNEHISSLNKTSKYFKEFNKAIEQFSKLLEESEELKEKELPQKKDTNKENNNNPSKYSSKKSNESGGSINLTKNSSKVKLNNKKLDSMKNRSHTQGVFKPPTLKKQATNVNLARSIFANKLMEEKKVMKQKKKIVKSPEMDKTTKSFYTHREGINETPTRIKTSYGLDKSSANLKISKTEKRIKTNNKKSIIKDKDKNKKNYKSNNISEYKTEKEKNYTEREKMNLMKFNTNLKKNMNKNNKNDKSKKGIKFNLQNKEKESSSPIAEFSKTINENYFTKTLDLNDYNKTKMSLSTKKKRKFRLSSEKENINDIKDIVKLVDNVNQNITKLF